MLLIGITTTLCPIRVPTTALLLLARSSGCVRGDAGVFLKVEPLYPFLSQLRTLVVVGG
jgi:hypothetical protein